MENRFLNLFRRLAGRQDHVDDALMVDPTRVADFLRGSVSPDMFRQALLRFNDSEGDTRQAPDERLHNAGDNVMCYFAAEGAVFGPLVATSGFARANMAVLCGRMTCGCGRSSLTVVSTSKCFSKRLLFAIGQQAA